MDDNCAINALYSIAVAHQKSPTKWLKPSSSYSQF